MIENNLFSITISIRIPSIILSILVLCLTFLGAYRSTLGIELDTAEAYIGKAYVITMKSRIHEHLKMQLLKAGFQPQILDAVQPWKELYSSSKRHLAQCMVAKGDEIDRASLYYSASMNLSLAEIALICSHRKALEFTAKDPQTKDSDWSIILEDDARLNPAVRKNPRDYISYALETLNSKPSNYGFLYLGICAGTCNEQDRLGILGGCCSGYCAHAYAITKYRARFMYDEMYHTQYGSLPAYFNRTNLAHIDQAFYAQFHRTCHNSTSASIDHQPNAYVLGYSFGSPHNPTHQGIFYQANRVDVHLGSNLIGLNNFTAMTCFKMIPTGEIGEFMFQYATLMGICVRRGGTPDNCAFVSSNFNEMKPSTNKRTEDVSSPELDFFQKFQLPIPNPSNCPPIVGNHSYYSEDHSPLNSIKYDAEVFNQPSGTTFHGKFHSYRYFHHVNDIIQDRFYFSTSTKVKARQLLQSIYSKTSTDHALVCMHVRKGTHKYDMDSLNTWSNHEYFFYSALNSLRMNLTKIAVITFLSGTPLEKKSKSRRDVVKNVMNRFVNNSEVQFLDVLECGQDDLTSMYAISLCPHIVLGMSSFGWWAAYLAKDAQVVVPGAISYKSKIVYDMGDYYLPEWKIKYVAESMTQIKSKKRKKSN